MSKRRAPRLAAVLSALVVSVSTLAASPSTTLIVNATIVDGTGAPERHAAVRVQGERIAAIGALEPHAGETIIDAAGLVLAPGFIDTHSHHDIELFEQPDALAAVSQGITTIVVGQDGTSSEPLATYFRRFKQTLVAVNVASYVGHNTVREAVMGKDFRRAATTREIARMRALVRKAMQAGALGLSTGLEYDPGIYSTPDEVLALAQEAARFHGRYISHLRSEDRALWQALDEIVNIGKVTRMPLQVSHAKLAMTDWWGQAGRFIEVLDRARADGVKITLDVYPYEYWQSTLTVLFPQRDFTDRAAAEFALRSLAPADGLRLARFSPEPALQGRTVAQVAAARGSDAPRTLMDLIAQSRAPGAEESVIGTSMDNRDIAALIAWPHANVCSDGSLADQHPRGAGAFTRVLRQYVREQRTLTLTEAVRKMSSAAARHVGIAERGVLAVGAYADLVLFDPRTVTDRATLDAPQALSEGIEKVWVNGALVFEHGRSTGRRSGRVIRNKAPW